MKCTMVTQISNMGHLFAYIYIYWFLTLVGIALVSFRDDRLVILNDFKKGLNKGFLIAFIHLLLTLLVMPFTIPFSIVRIISKWF